MINGGRSVPRKISWKRDP